MRQHTSDEFGRAASATTDLNSGDGQVTGTTLIMLQGIDEERDANPYVVHTAQPGLALWKLIVGLIGMLAAGIAIIVSLVWSGAVGWQPYLFHYAAKPPAAVTPRLAVTIRNESSETIPAARLQRADGNILAQVPSVSAGSSVTVRPPLVAHASNSLVLVGSDGRAYPLVNTLDGNPGGTVVVIVKGRKDGVLNGQVIDRSGDRSGWRKWLAAN